MKSLINGIRVLLVPNRVVDRDLEPELGLGFFANRLNFLLSFSFSWE